MTKKTPDEAQNEALDEALDESLGGEQPALAGVAITAYRAANAESNAGERRSDEVIVEAPLLIRLGYTPDGGTQLSWHDLVVTMRTPGDDRRLAVGYLLAEGVIEHRSQVAAIAVGPYVDPQPPEGNGGAEPAYQWPAVAPAVVTVTLEPSCQISETCLRQRAIASSSCGICGKTALADLLRRSSYPLTGYSQTELSLELLAKIDRQTRAHQPLFQRCGAVHSCGLFTAEGALVAMFEDVGRHNAFDKLVGYLCEREELPAKDSIVWLSGRVSYELMQKAIMAGIGAVVAVGAPSQLAVHLAKTAHIQLAGFADGRRFNLYS